MGNWVSKDGVFHPAKETAGLVNNTDKPIVNPSAEWSKHFGEIVQPGEPYIYEGADRSAMFELAEAFGMDKDGKPKVTTFGSDFRYDPELIARVRQLGYKDMDEYLKIVGYDKAKIDADFKEKASEIVRHKLPERKPEPILSGGGMSTANNETMVGGFGEQRLRPISEAKK